MVRVIWGKGDYHTGVRHEDETELLIPTSFRRASRSLLNRVKAELDAAAEQAQRYGAALSERYSLTDLRLYAVVGIGLERVVWRVV